MQQTRSHPTPDPTLSASRPASAAPPGSASPDTALPDTAPPDTAPPDTAPPGNTPADSGLTHIVKTAGALSFGIVELAALLDDADKRAKAQTQSVRALHDEVERVATGNQSVDTAITTVAKTADAMVQKVNDARDVLGESSEWVIAVVDWVENNVRRMQEVEEKLFAVQQNAEKISEISLQVHLLAINAKIEAARAGTYGRGFSVVADAINDLSEQTAGAAKGIGESTTMLSTWVNNLREHSEQTSEAAQRVRACGVAMTRSLEEISDATGTTRSSINLIGDRFHDVTESFASFVPRFDALYDQNNRIGRHIHQIHTQSQALIDGSERILQLGVSQGGSSADQRFIHRVQQDAARIGALFETAIAKGEITRAALFSRSYTPIPGTDPEQIMAPFTPLTDRYLPAIQEEALTLDPRIAFCAAVNRDGYLPTHNRKFSHPQGADPVQNAARARNRRLFNDRVGLKAGQSTAPFLLQAYRRDMGGGEFRLMKDLSAPIYVNGAHWGGLRLAYGVD